VAPDDPPTRSGVESLRWAAGGIGASRLNTITRCQWLLRRPVARDAHDLISVDRLALHPERLARVIRASELRTKDMDVELWIILGITLALLAGVTLGPRRNKKK
jgi:hypothetical protein